MNDLKSQTTIVLPISSAELIQSLEMVNVTARSAAVPAKTHEDVRAVLAFIIGGIQPEAPIAEQVPSKSNTKATVKPALPSKKKESDKAKASALVKEMPMDVSKKPAQETDKK